MERRSYCANASDKPLAKVSKAQELLNFVTAIRRGPLSHCTHFSRIHLHSSRGYSEAQGGGSFILKLTFFCFYIQVVVNEPLEDLANVVFVSVQVC